MGPPGQELKHAGSQTPEEMGNGENASNHHFSVFQQYLLPYQTEIII